MFDERANGYARGEGIGTIIIKPLTKAIENNDPIYAVVRNSRINQDGRTRGITNPSEHSQASLIAETYREVGLDPRQTDFFEAHGTGTKAGDKAEASALAKALQTETRDPGNPLHVGSVKTIIGHCEAASGIAGILHATMALKHKCILPNLNFLFPSDNIKFEKWRIKVG